MRRVQAPDVRSQSRNPEELAQPPVIALIVRAARANGSATKEALAEIGGHVRNARHALARSITPRTDPEFANTGSLAFADVEPCVRIRTGIPTGAAAVEADRSRTRSRIRRCRNLNFA